MSALTRNESETGLFYYYYHYYFDSLSLLSWCHAHMQSSGKSLDVIRDLDNHKTY